MRREALWTFFNCSDLELDAISVEKQIQAGMILEVKAAIQSKRMAGDKDPRPDDERDDELEAEYAARANA